MGSRVWAKVDRWESTQFSRGTEALGNTEAQRNGTLE